MVLNENVLATLKCCSDFGKQDDTPFLSNTAWHRVCTILSKQGLEIGDLLALPPSELIEAGIEFDLAQRINQLNKKKDIFLEMADLEAGTDCVTLTADHTQYPTHLIGRLKGNCPPVLFAKGNLELLNEMNPVAVTGMRECDEQALAYAHTIGQLSAKYDYVLISGGAKGIDITSQTSALESGGASIFVLPCGLETKAVQLLQDKLVGRYLLLSSCMPFAAFSAVQAIERNRLIYALSNLAFVVCAKNRTGGTWSGAKQCLQNHYCRVYTFIDLTNSVGNFELIHLGAAPITIERVERILSEEQTKQKIELM